MADLTKVLAELERQERALAKAQAQARAVRRVRPTLSKQTSAALPRRLSRVVAESQRLAAEHRALSAKQALLKMSGRRHHVSAPGRARERRGLCTSRRRGSRRSTASSSRGSPRGDPPDESEPGDETGLHQRYLAHLCSVVVGAV